MLREAFILKTTYFLSDKKWWLNFLHGECESSYLHNIIFHLNLTVTTWHQEKRDVPVREAISDVPGYKRNNAFLRASLTGDIQGRELSSSPHVITGVYIVTYCYNTGGVYFYTHQLQSVLWMKRCTIPFLLKVLYQTHVSMILTV